jgi:hypothetical protein
MAELNINEILGLVKEAEAAEVNAGFKPLPSGAYEATLTKFGVYENNFGNNSMHVEVEIKTEDREDPVVIKIDRGLTLKDGKPNSGTLSMMKEIFNATGVDINSAKTGSEVIKAFGKDVQLTSFPETYNKKVLALVREVLDQNNEAYPKSNTIEGIFNLDGTNSKGEDQLETFKKKIEEKPVLVKAKKTAGAASAPNSSAAKKRL